MKSYFCGQYYKHHKGNRTLALIVGRTETEHFIQAITDDCSVQIPFQDGNFFTKRGVRLRIHSPRLSVEGTIRYGKLSPIAYDIMGPFRFFPMECRHGIISMRHKLKGSVMVNGEEWDFTGGEGYMEMDCGRSFPRGYTWIQANDFTPKCAVMAAVASIPFCKIRFRGCICIIQYDGREYRLATYLGVRVIRCTPEEIILQQGKYRLEIRIGGRNAQPLAAPQNGSMVRTIREAVSCPADFRFLIKGRELFHLSSSHAGFEWEKA